MNKLLSSFAARVIFVSALLMLNLLYWVRLDTPRKDIGQPLVVKMSRDFKSSFIQPEKIEGSRQKLIYLTRIISNDLPPMHFEDQTYLNTKAILNHEPLPSNFRRFWVIYCVMNKTTELRLEKLIQSKQEKYHIVPFSSSKDVAAVIKETLNNDRARNIGVQMSFDDGAEWVHSLDGCQFLTGESISNLDRALNSLKDTQIFHFVPLVRLWYKINVTEALDYQTLFPFVSGLEEATVVVNKKFLEQRPKIGFIKETKGLIYDEDRTYAQAEKLTFLQNAKRNLNSTYISCLQVVYSFIFFLRFKIPLQEMAVFAKDGIEIRWLRDKPELVEP
ncbi:uncharacterized protein LOC134846762 [Symsagittifera roscoffensis]|uniref:uncharacterized protein LOC134846762 n=1 Tax=Symsagittifera roscoffensis TaxID=84072 RepID=UPI00307B8F19